MPYIEQDPRDKYDPAINNIVKLLENKDCNPLAGELAYVLYKICLGVCKRYGSTTFFRLNMIVGVLDNIKDEFKRQVLFSYEDAKKELNGDIK